MIDYSIIGRRYGRLTVISLDHLNKKKATYWLCKCDCGKQKVISRSGLTSGDIISCGCYKKEHNKEFGLKHGLSNSKLYSTWSGIVQRCTNKNASNYKRYGGRGIKICDEWKNSFQCFYDWAVSSGYSDELTIDRINVNGNYEPSNCRWVSMSVQANNTRRNHYFEYNGVVHTIAQWSRILNVNHETLRYRINHNNFVDFETLPHSELITQKFSEN